MSFCNAKSSAKYCHDTYSVQCSRCLNVKDSAHVNPWIEVDLAERTVVSGVTTQGCRLMWEYTTQYKVAYKKQPQCDFDYVRDASGEIELFTGNTDGAGQVSNMFPESVIATVLRIELTALGNEMYCLRMELLGCRLE
ncbi:lactadherin-like [Patiria miniata]|uniref:F5/8 type C domain-containing protein n=1 Tax=Patiria miniata TaxID=46514 RepID=A0A914AMV8_PATMI|nr:lactadherin-like [Patiria miniata]